MLQFYGAQSLAKALVIANSPSIGLQDLKYHGLSTRSKTLDPAELDRLSAYSRTPTAWAIEHEFGIVNDGVFRELSRVAGDPLNGLAVLRFRDLIRCLPDLSQMYCRHYGEPSHALRLYSQPVVDEQGRFEIYFSGAQPWIDAKSVFPEFDDGYEPVQKHGNPGFRSAIGSAPSPSFGVVEHGTVAGWYYVRPHPCGAHRSLTLAYASLYILGNVVRYKPSFWMSVMEGSQSGSIAIVEAFCGYVKRRYPNDILDEIWGERFTFGSPGYFA